MCTHTRTRMRALTHMHTHTIPMTSTTFTGLVTTTVPVPEMSSCGGGYLMVHGCIRLNVYWCRHYGLYFFLSVSLFIWFGVGWFGLNCFWVETVTEVCSSSFDGSEPLPRWKRFKKVVCRVSGVRDYGCGFAKSAGCVDWLQLREVCCQWTLRLS